MRPGDRVKICQKPFATGVIIRSHRLGGDVWLIDVDGSNELWFIECEHLELLDAVTQLGELA